LVSLQERSRGKQGRECPLKKKEGKARLKEHKKYRREDGEQNKKNTLREKKESQSSSGFLRF